jgi:hypothetical protein
MEVETASETLGYNPVLISTWHIAQEDFTAFSTRKNFNFCISGTSLVNGMPKDGLLNGVLNNGFACFFRTFNRKRRLEKCDVEQAG